MESRRGLLRRAAIGCARLGRGVAPGARVGARGVPRGGRGWTRVDPTAVVAPERLRRGIFDLFPAAMSSPLRLWRGSAWLTRLLQGWDATNNWWNGHVVRFTLDSH